VSLAGTSGDSRQRSGERDAPPDKRIIDIIAADPVFGSDPELAKMLETLSTQLRSVPI
jgi:hypothetical protein